MADGRGLPFADGAFDIAHASMVVHHLDPDDAVAFLRELRRVARHGLVVNDLVRGRLNWLGAWLLIHATATSRFTRHDGPLSVRRAYTRAELLDLVAAAGLEPVATSPGSPATGRDRGSLSRGARPGSTRTSRYAAAMERREVLVVGGGPAGAATAIGLAGRGP